jgi:hypothetical protein
MEVVLRTGVGEYPLGERDAGWLASVIRTTCVDTAGRAWDREARAALQVADVIAEHLARGYSPKPIELEQAAALGILFHAFLDKHLADVRAQVARSDDVAALYLALRRFGREAA